MRGSGVEIQRTRSEALPRMMGAPVKILLCSACVFLFISPPTTTAFRVLGLFPFNGHSHNIFFKAMMEALAEKGHQVTVLSSFPLKTPKANYTDVDLSKILPSLVNTLSYDMMTNPTAGSVAGLVQIVSDLAGNSLCRKVFQSQQFKDIMDRRYGDFDVVFTEVFGSDCFAAVAQKLKLPLISMSSAPDVPWMHDRMGSIDNPSYIGNVFTGVLGKMDFLERAVNAYFWYLTNSMHKKLMIDGSDDVVREFLGADAPPLAETVKNTSLILVNRHVSINAARPTTPNVVNVGGLHLRVGKNKTKQMDAELRKWMDEADEGVILFSLGSLVPSSTLPASVQRDILNALSSVPQKVIWKFETKLDNLPPNVRISKWLPQSEVLAHPKLILFITHGGLMGTLEALTAGIPMLGIPLFADQMVNIELYRTLGIAECLDHKSLNKEGLSKSIKQMTLDDRYLKRAREIAALYGDRPHSAEEEAVWWVEYVVRNRGAPHLRPLGADMPLYQYLLLDVVAAAVAVAVLTLFLLRSLIGMWCSGGPSVSKVKKS